VDSKKGTLSILFPLTVLRLSNGMEKDADFSGRSLLTLDMTGGRGGKLRSSPRFMADEYI
jgi:hypothetical protein